MNIRVTFFILTFLVLTSCGDLIEDNTPSVNDLKRMYKELFAECLGVPSYETDEMPFEERVACMDAVMS